MAKTRSRTEELTETLRARGLRRQVAEAVADAIGSGPRKKAPKAVSRIVADLKSAAGEIEDRATGKTAKRKAAARKAAATRKRNEARRSASAKKGAKTRAKKSTPARAKKAPAKRR